MKVLVDAFDPAWYHGARRNYMACLLPAKSSFMYGTRVHRLRIRIRVVFSMEWEAQTAEEAVKVK